MEQSYWKYESIGRRHTDDMGPGTPPGWSRSLPFVQSGSGRALYIGIDPREISLYGGLRCKTRGDMNGPHIPPHHWSGTQLSIYIQQTPWSNMVGAPHRHSGQSHLRMCHQGHHQWAGRPQILQRWRRNSAHRFRCESIGRILPIGACAGYSPGRYDSPK